MRSSPGRWVQGDDFFGREAELALLAERVRDGNHVLLTGQRRMGKTSLARELGRRLELDGWLFFFVDVEEAVHPQDVVALIAQRVHSVRTLANRFASTMARLAANVEEISAYEFRLKVRANLDDGNWRRHGQELFESCANEPKPVLIVLDELPIFLLSLLRRERGRERVDEFLTWLRAVQQNVAGRGLTFIASGSIGLIPLATRLGLPDRINHLHTFRLQPWNRDTSAGCLARLSASHGLDVDSGVADAVVEKLGIGIPHHVQSFFAHLREDAMIKGRAEIRLEAVDRVYRDSLLAPWGQIDLMHYDTRLRDAFDERGHRIALEILTEAATQGILTATARDRFEAHLAALGDETPGRITTVLDVLVHDGYLVPHDDGHVFQSRLLCDWWIARFGRGHEPFKERAAAIAGIER
ncbi:MAG: ATP-binding protein [Gammaproteobacteria bacterium]|nr:ATP-binding protein [Gammaproteobacteria bacterium]